MFDEADVGRQSIKTWKESSDPEFDGKKRRIDRLTHRKHTYIRLLEEAPGKPCAD